MARNKNGALVPPAHQRLAMVATMTAAKTVMGFILCLCSVAYLGFFTVAIAEPRPHQTRVAILAGLVVGTCAVWAFGREAFVTAAHTLKELFSSCKEDK